MIFDLLRKIWSVQKTSNVKGRKTDFSPRHIGALVRKVELYRQPPLPPPFKIRWYRNPPEERPVGVHKCRGNVGLQAEDGLSDGGHHHGPGALAGSGPLERRHLEQSGIRTLFSHKSQG